MRPGEVEPPWFLGREYFEFWCSIADSRAMPMSPPRRYAWKLAAWQLCLKGRR